MTVLFVRIDAHIFRLVGLVKTAETTMTKKVIKILGNLLHFTGRKLAPPVKNSAYVGPVARVWEVFV